MIRGGVFGIPRTRQPNHPNSSKNLSRRSLYCFLATKFLGMKNIVILNNKCYMFTNIETKHYKLRTKQTIKNSNVL